MKTKMENRLLWTPEQVQGWLEHCPKPDGSGTYVFRGWIVDGNFFCAECVHTLVENGHNLPPQSPAIPLGTPCDDLCDGCGGKLKT